MVRHFQSLIAGAAIAAACLSAPAFAAEDKCALKPLLTLQMQKLPSGHVTLPITLNGRPSQLMFDTGGGVRSLTSSLVDELHLKRRTGMTTRNLQGNTSRDEVRVDLVEFGGLKFKDMTFSVMPTYVQEGPKNGSAKSIDMTGRMGTTLFDGLFTPEMFLKKADLDLDFAVNHFTLMSQHHCDGKVVYWPHTAVAVVPFHLDDGNNVVFEVKLDDKPMNAILDTGAYVSVLFQKRLADVIAPEELKRIRDKVPSDVRLQFKFKTLAFEGIAINNPSLMIMSLPETHPGLIGAPLATLNRQSPDMLVGMDVLSHLHVFIAYKEHKLYITSAAAPATKAAAEPVAGSAAPAEETPPTQ